MQRTINELLETPRMYFSSEHPHENSVRGLQMLIADHVKKDSVIAEVGSFSGVSSEMFALNCKELHCVDAWEAYWEIADPSVMANAEFAFDKMSANYSHIRKVKSASANAVLKYPDGFFDLVYIDAAHDYESAKRDIFLWMPKLKAGGIMAGHDYRHDPEIKVYEVVEEIFGTKYKIEKYPDSSWAVKLK
jgi:predicted O-methyltransferase YrrM